MTNPETHSEGPGAGTAAVLVALINGLPKILAAARRFLTPKKPPVEDARYQLDRMYGRLREIWLFYASTRPAFFPTAQHLLREMTRFHAAAIEIRDKYEELKKDPWYDTDKDIKPTLKEWIEEHNSCPPEYRVEPLK